MKTKKKTNEPTKKKGKKRWRGEEDGSNTSYPSAFTEEVERFLEESEKKPKVKLGQRTFLYFVLKNQRISLFIFLINRTIRTSLNRNKTFSVQIINIINENK